jgi:hypothetical protein
MHSLHMKKMCGLHRDAHRAYSSQELVEYLELALVEYLELALVEYLELALVKYLELACALC